MSTAGVITLIAVLIGICFVVFNIWSSLAGGTSVESAFRSAWRSEFHSEPPQKAVEGISGAVMVIRSYHGQGSKAIAVEKLQSNIDTFAQAVSYSEEKMELGLGCLLSCCMGNQRGAVVPGYKWAADVITEYIFRYCPSISFRALSRS